ncbi:RlpA-like double-psi beta-barrel-protein domain-containing protein-containing protein [Xylariaceae sp. FL0255]|nr:RlpA-like double-psi beta-barrel-protein domain-containing protein-containing protein [Xylariaceae sp. FL0255]
MPSLLMMISLLAATVFTIVNAAAVSPNPAVLSREAINTGDMAWFPPGLGACGKVNSASDTIVALSADIFDLQTPNGNPNNNPLCGKQVCVTSLKANDPITNQLYQIRINFNGKSAVATIEDRCPSLSCAEYAIDVGPAVFSQLDDLSVGHVSV